MQNTDFQIKIQVTNIRQGYKKGHKVNLKPSKGTAVNAIGFRVRMVIMIYSRNGT